MTRREMDQLKNEYGYMLRIIEMVVLHGEVDYPNKYIISYCGVNVGNELMEINLVRENITSVIKQLRDHRLEEYVKFEIADSGGYADQATMLADLKLCDEVFSLNLDMMEREDCQWFWSGLAHNINREKKTFGSWVPEFATKVAHSKYESKAKELIEKYYYSVQQVLGFIYGLYEDYEINEPEEMYLYKVIDPEDKYPDPIDYWKVWEYANPLEQM